MSILSTRIEADTKEAMKAKQEAVVSALRLVRSVIKNKQIELSHELSDEEATAVLRTLVKQYKDALADFTSAGRTDLVERQTAEIELLERYLPAGLSAAEIDALVQGSVAELRATVKDAGRVMGVVMKEVAGRADGNAVRASVERVLREQA